MTVVGMNENSKLEDKVKYTFLTFPKDTFSDCRKYFKKVINASPETGNRDKTKFIRDFSLYDLIFINQTVREYLFSKRKLQANTNY